MKSTNQKTESVRLDIPVKNLFRGKYQPRNDFDTESLNELCLSIQTHGVISPVTVREAGKGKYEIIAGERRCRASKIVGLTHIPCIVKNLSDKEAALIGLIENVQRENLSPFEVAEHIRMTFDMFQISKTDIGKAIGKSRSWVSNLLRLTEVADSVKILIRSRKIEATHARALLSLKHTDQLMVARQIIAEKLTVQQTETIVRGILAPTKEPSKARRDIHFTKLEERLSEVFGAEVKFLQSKKGNGSIEIPFYSREELEGIKQKINKINKTN
jgi:ParB family chromosome partitioning protein